MRIRVVSFHNGNLNPEIIRLQKAVFHKFEIDLEQIETRLPHPDAIDSFLQTEEWDIVVLFDADCIPLNQHVVDYAVDQVKRGHAIFGASQKASHIPGSKIYVSPCFMALNKSVWEEIGKPSFRATNRGDVAEEISYGCRKHGVVITMLYPTTVEVEKWDLLPGIRFGNGTTYGKSVYHAFESNANGDSTDRFITKCLEVLGAE